MAALEDYLHSERPGDDRKWQLPALFLTCASSAHGNGRLKPLAIDDIWNQVCRLAEVEGKTPHSARHAMGKHLIEKTGNLAANAAAMIMLGASGVQVGKYIMEAAAGCLGSESDRCNICNIDLCPKGITSQDPRLYRRLDPEQVAQRIVDVFISFDIELKKIVAPLGRSTSLPIGMSDALGINDKHVAERLSIKYVV